MKKVGHTTYMLKCEYCDLEYEAYQEKEMKAHEAAHKYLLSLPIGKRVRYRYAYETSDWGRSYMTSEERVGKLISIRKTSEALIETDEGERLWVDMDDILGVE